MKRVIVTGDRHWHCRDLARVVIVGLQRLYGAELVVVHGAAPGVDNSFDRAARDLGMREPYVEPHPAAWGRLGKRAGPLRNTEMVIAEPKAILGVAVHRNIAVSGGTKDCVTQMTAAGIPVWLIHGFEGGHAEALLLRGGPDGWQSAFYEDAAVRGDTTV